MVKRGSISLYFILFFVVIFSLNLASAALNVSLADQGSGLVTTSTNLLLPSGNLSVDVYDALTGGTNVYHENFTDAILEGSWNVMLGEVTSLPLEFGRVYYKDYKINGEDADFTNGTGGSVERQFFYSPLGDFNSSKFLKTGGLIVNNTGSVGIGTSTPLADFHFVGTEGKALFASAQDDASSKQARIGVSHYNIAEKPFIFIFGSTASDENTLFLGGGTGLGNAATAIFFDTAANSTISTGTECMRIDASGNVVISLSYDNNDDSQGVVDEVAVVDVGEVVADDVSGELSDAEGDINLNGPGEGSDLVIVEGDGLEFEDLSEEDSILVDSVVD